VIQGVKCVKFNEIHFQKLKDLVPQVHTNSSFDENMNKKDLNTTVIEKEQFVKKDDSALDSSITFEKQLMSNVTSTPKNKEKQTRSPKERLEQQSQTISTKLETVFSSLSSVETTLQSFTTKLPEIKSETDNILPNMKTYITNNSSNQKLNQFKDQMESIVKKMTQCNSAIGSLHIKMNLIDSQLKDQNEKLVEKMTTNIANFEIIQTKTKESLENMQIEISSLRHRLSAQEQDGLSVPIQITNEKRQQNETKEPLDHEDSVILLPPTKEATLSKSVIIYF